MWQPVNQFDIGHIFEELLISRLFCILPDENMIREPFDRIHNGFLDPAVKILGRDLSAERDDDPSFWFRIQQVVEFLEY